jgi:hypothetical protein
MSATEKIDDIYDRLVNDRVGEGDIVVDQIDWEDTLGFKVKLSFPLFGTKSYVSAHHAGLVADGGAPLKDFGWRDPTGLPYSGLGNKQEYEAGMIMYFGDIMIAPRILYRDNLVHANPYIPPSIEDGILSPGISPRDRDNDPFAVLDNREARAGEIYLTYDPTGATPLFFFQEGGVNASFGKGLPAEEVWTVSSRLVFNPNRRATYIADLIKGFNQSTRWYSRLLRDTRKSDIRG